VRASAKADLSALREGARSGGGQRARLRSALVVAEVMASVVLLVSAGLLMRALDRIRDTDLGFRPVGVLTMRTALPLPPYDTTARRVQFYGQVLTRVRALPGVQSAAYISGLPMQMSGGIWPVALTGDPKARTPGHTASLRYATPGYFATLGIPVRRGRDLAETDGANAPAVAVVSESFARHFFPNEDALGKRFQFAMAERTVVGIAGDVRVRGPEQSSEPQVYLSYQQVPDNSIVGYIPKDLAIRSSAVPGEGGNAALLAAVREIIRTADPLQPISGVRTMQEIVSDATASRVVQVRVIAAFAVIAFLLAAVGIHGLLAYTVSQRRHEFGVRMALGAQRSAIVRMVMQQGVRLALGGVLPGVLLAYGAGRGMSALLAGVAPGDAITFLAAASLCVLMTLAGSLLPVLRAVNVAPASAFRGES
jgi:predicted permease